MNRFLASRAAPPLVLFLVVLPLLVGTWSHAVADQRHDLDRAAVVSAGARMPSEGTDSLLRSLVGGAPFRVTRSASDVPYDPIRSDPEFQAIPTRPPRPLLVVSGIVSGSRPAAVIEGIPGRDRALLMQAGDTAGGLKVRRIMVDKVVVTGFDTTWTLLVRRPW